MSIRPPAACRAFLARLDARERAIESRLESRRGFQPRWHSFQLVLVTLLCQRRRQMLPLGRSEPLTWSDCVDQFLRRGPPGVRTTSPCLPASVCSWLIAVLPGKPTALRIRSLRSARRPRRSQECPRTASPRRRLVREYSVVSADVLPRDLKPLAVSSSTPDWKAGRGSEGRTDLRNGEHNAENAFGLNLSPGF